MKPLTSRQQAVLRIIRDNPGCSSAAVCDALGISGAQFTQTSGTLISRRLIGRQHDFGRTTERARWHAETAVRA